VPQRPAGELDLGVDLLALGQQDVVLELAARVIARVEQHLGLEVEQEVQLVAVGEGVHVALGHDYGDEGLLVELVGVEVDVVDVLVAFVGVHDHAHDCFELAGLEEVEQTEEWLHDHPHHDLGFQPAGLHAAPVDHDLAQLRTGH